MAQTLRRANDAAEVEELLAEAEALIDRAGEAVDDPIQLNKLKEAQFTLWKIRAERHG